jgi:site-specific recombinase XerD
MMREMSWRECSASTQRWYLATVTDLARYHHHSPDTLDPTQVQNVLLYLTRERPLAWRAVSVAASAIRFFDTHTVKRLDLAMAMPSRRKPRRLPHILRVEEVARVRSILRHPTHRVRLMTTYAAGLRVTRCACLITGVQLTWRAEGADAGAGRCACLITGVQLTWRAEGRPR